jgi:hypothetical protein
MIRKREAILNTVGAQIVVVAINDFQEIAGNLPAAWQ